MIFRHSPALAALILVPLLAGCAGEIPHPSLSPRRSEQLTVPTIEESAPRAVLPQDAPRETQLAALLQQAREGDARFREELGTIEPVVMRGGGNAAGSENWVEAQKLVSRLETLRAPVTRSLSDLDQLQILIASEGGGTVIADEVARAVDEVRAMADREEADVNRLASALRPL